VDEGESVSVTLKREFMEEALAGEHCDEKKFQIEKLFKHPRKKVYQGYVDDPRNTDNAWMETTAVHFHCPPEMAEWLELTAGSDAAAVTWTDVGGPECKSLYANHGQFVEAATSDFKET